MSNCYSLFTSVLTSPSCN